MVRGLALLIGLALVTLFPPAAARAVGMTVPIDQPLPEQLRPPIRTFLESLGIIDIVPALDATKTVCEATTDAGFVLFRVQHPETCIADSCLTVIGRLHSGNVVAEQSFLAKDWYLQGDMLGDLWGTASAPKFFLNGDAMLSVVQTARGWLVVPIKAEPLWKDRAPVNDASHSCASRSGTSPEPTTADPTNFERFQQILEGLR